MYQNTAVNVPFFGYINQKKKKNYFLLWIRPNQISDIVLGLAGTKNFLENIKNTSKLKLLTEQIFIFSERN